MGSWFSSSLTPSEMLEASKTAIRRASRKTAIELQNLQMELAQLEERLRTRRGVTSSNQMSLCELVSMQRGQIEVLSYTYNQIRKLENNVTLATSRDDVVQCMRLTGSAMQAISKDIPFGNFVDILQEYDKEMQRFEWRNGMAADQLSTQNNNGSDQQQIESIAAEFGLDIQSSPTIYRNNDDYNNNEMEIIGDGDGDIAMQILNMPGPPGPRHNNHQAEKNEF